MNKVGIAPPPEISQHSKTPSMSPPLLGQKLKLRAPMMLPPASPSPRVRLPAFQVILITEAGRSLYHYVQPGSPNHSRTTALSAAFAAFSATTSNLVSTITTPSLTLLTISKPPVLLAIASQTLQHPVSYLRALARQTLTALYTCLSASFIQHLTNFPTYDPTSITSTFEPLLNRIITSALTYPLPLTLSLIPSLPAPFDPTSHTVFRNAISQALTDFKQVSNLLIFTASHPSLRRIIASASRPNSRLLPLDLLILLQIPHQTNSDNSVIPDRLFLPSCGFRSGLRVALRALTLNIDSDNRYTNPTSVSAVNFQSLSNIYGEALWVMVLGEWKVGQHTGQMVLDYVESSLDQSRVAKDVMVALKRPWRIPDITAVETFCRHVKGALMLGNERFVETLDACAPFDYHLTAAVLRTRQLSSGSFFSHAANGVLVVMCEKRYVVVFDDQISEEDASYVMRRAFLPWMKRFQTSLLPIDKGTIVQPSTPLAGVLAPFSS